MQMATSLYGNRCNTGTKSYKYKKPVTITNGATGHMDTEAVAEQIEKIHAEYASVVQYNNENSLSSVLSIAY